MHKCSREGDCSPNEDTGGEEEGRSTGPYDEHVTGNLKGDVTDVEDLRGERDESPSAG